MIELALTPSALKWAGFAALLLFTACTAYEKGRAAERAEVERLRAEEAAAVSEYRDGLSARAVDLMGKMIGDFAAAEKAAKTAREALAGGGVYEYSGTVAAADCAPENVENEGGGVRPGGGSDGGGSDGVRGAKPGDQRVLQGPKPGDPGVVCYKTNELQGRVAKSLDLAAECDKLQIKYLRLYEYCLGEGADGDEIP